MDTWRANVFGSQRVFDAAAEAGTPVVVHASSIGAYSPGPEDGPVDESWPTHSVPSAGYGREKAYVERLLDIFELAHPDVRVVRLRPAFIFKRASATEQRRVFAGPFLPGRLVRPGRLPVLPYPAGLHLQALHSADVAEAYHLAVTEDVRGAFNVAADEVLDGPALAEILGARPREVPRGLVRAAVAAGWHARAVPADPQLFDLFMDLPVIDTGRARRELGWSPRYSAQDAISELIEGIVSGAGGGTAPLAPDSPDRRLEELSHGVGSHL
jgi:nucleoside-diphosphate-sugar epimerase